MKYTIEEMQDILNKLHGNELYTILGIASSAHVRRLNVKCNNCGRKWDTRWEHLRNGSGCVVCRCGRTDDRRMTLESKQDYINEKIGAGKIEIVRRVDGDTFEFKCCRCGKLFERNWNSFRNVLRCRRCDYIRLADEYKHLEKFLVNKDDLYEYAPGDPRKIRVACPLCGREKEIHVSVLIRKGFSCTYCSDKISYPEKFVLKLLELNSMEFERQFAPLWADKKLYDFYIPSLNTIIETHGMQHYKDVLVKRGSKSAKEEQENDKIKESLARENGVTNYIVLDCRYSKLEQMKNSILNSALKDICKNLSDEIFNQCDIYALYSNEKEEIWKMYDSGMTIAEIGKEKSHNNYQIREILKYGVRIGKCTYEKPGNKVKIIDSKTNEIVKTTKTIQEAAEFLGVSASTVARWCKKECVPKNDHYILEFVA